LHSPREKKVSVFLVAANRLLREALSRVLCNKGNFHVIDACAPEDALLDRISAAHPDVVLLEGENALAPNLRFVRELIRATPDVRIVLLGMAEDELTFLDAVRSGVCGYVLRDAAALDVLNAVRAAGDGEVFCPPRLCMALFRDYSRQAMRVPSAKMRVDFGLTRREQQLLPMIAQGMTNKEIAGTLNLAEQTIKNHIHRMLQRVGANDRLEVVELIRVQGAYVD
jgi:DNA-binding NarL/FixJ family response regulator